MKPPAYHPRPPRLKGACAVCGQQWDLKNDGTLWFHHSLAMAPGTFHRLPCNGSGQPPKEQP